MYINPPDGEKYGFPKIAPDRLADMNDSQVYAWLVKNNYPQEEIDKREGKLFCKVFEK